jgi:lambda family phage minor tail protein L
MTIPFSEAQLPAPTALIELFELELISAIHGVGTVYLFHAGVTAKGDGSELVWAGNSYMTLPIEADGFSYSGNGPLPRPTLRVSNVMGTITALLLALPAGLEGAKITRRRTHARYLDAVNFPGNVNPLGTPDPTAEYPIEQYFIDRKKSESREVVEFELAAAFDLAGVRAPKRQVIASICTWVYRSAECGYSGGLPSCTKSLADCRAHFGANSVLPFGGFPGAGAY